MTQEAQSALFFGHDLRPKIAGSQKFSVMEGRSDKKKKRKERNLENGEKEYTLDNGD